MFNLNKNSRRNPKKVPRNPDTQNPVKHIKRHSKKEYRRLLNEARKVAMKGNYTTENQ